MKLFPGQVEKLVFTLPQVELLASPFKGDVFWAFSSTEPLSISDVAKELGKSSQGIHYHVVSLVEAGMLIAVGERKRHARIEKLYVRAGYLCIDMGRDGTPEYFEYRKKGFAGTTRAIAREIELLYDCVAQDPDYYDHFIFRRAKVHLSRSQVLELRERLLAILEELRARPVDKDEPKMHVLVYACPTAGQSREWLDEEQEDKA